MFNNVALDVFIGLIFVYLLYSLLATIIQEIIASYCGLRGRMLQKALRRMLNDGDNEESGFFIMNLFYEIKDNIIHFFDPYGNTDSLLRKFYSHPSVKYLGEGKLFKKPSYLHAHNFSQTLMQLLRGDSYNGRTENESELVRQSLENNTLQINPQTLRQLSMLFADARQDTYLFKHKLEDWFEETMERTTGWYKKQTQLILICLGFFLASMFNVDTIAITRILTKDKNIRDQMVQLAISKQKEYGGIIDSVKTTIVRTEIKNDSVTRTVDSVVVRNRSDKFLDSIRNSLQQDAIAVQGILGLDGITTSADSSSCRAKVSLFDSMIVREADPVKKVTLDSMKKKLYESCLYNMNAESPFQKSTGLKIIGWLITALAISLGASFWFDLLSKFIRLRQTGPVAGNMAAIDQSSVRTSAPGKLPIKDDNNSDIKG
jgi:hypothetical protein